MTVSLAYAEITEQFEEEQALDSPKYVEQLGIEARTAARALAVATTAQKNRALELAADAIEANSAALLDANAIDLASVAGKGKTDAFIDRLKLDGERIAVIC